MATRSHKKVHEAVLCWRLGRDGLELRSLMDLWIMGLLYKLIVRGSRLHGAFGEKGLVRSLYATGGMCGRGPVFTLDVQCGGQHVWTEGQTRSAMGGGRTIRRPQNRRDSNDLLRFVRKADENSSSGDLGRIYCVGIIVLWIFFCLCTFFFRFLFISLKFFSPPSNLPFATGFTPQYWVHPENHSAE